MKRKALTLLLCLMVLGMNAERNFITDAAYRGQVKQAYTKKLAQLKLDFSKESAAATAYEQEALQFLYAYMPVADATDYSYSYYLNNVRATFKAQQEMAWGQTVPELLFRHFVLPLRVNNEALDNARIEFYKELKDRVKGLGMKDAILEVNHWCHEHVTYQPSDARTLSPMACKKTAIGRCGEESTFTVAALRSVGIPARQVYHPKMGTHRRQPRVGGGLGRWSMVLPRCLRARSHSQSRLVQRSSLSRHADAHPCIRRLSWTRRGDAAHQQLHRNQSD